jgi:GNAT superfamily N-acetyltransferase
MLTLQPIRTADTELYLFMEQLLTTSFPTAEYRDLSDLRHNTDTLENFYNCVLTDDQTPIGICSFWQFERFTYVEHLATLPRMRSCGYGSQALDLLKQRNQLPIVLEAELPMGRQSIRRLLFYERNGFKMWTDYYVQPPYRAGDGYMALCLLVYGNQQSNNLTFEEAKRTIYREVYGTDGTVSGS